MFPHQGEVGAGRLAPSGWRRDGSWTASPRIPRSVPSGYRCQCFSGPEIFVVRPRTIEPDPPPVRLTNMGAANGMAP